MATDRSSLEARLNDLEARHMELEHLVDKLNEVVTDQADQLQELARKSAALREQVLRGDPGGKQDPLSEPPPPHY